MFADKVAQELHRKCLDLQQLAISFIKILGAAWQTLKQVGEFFHVK